MGDSTSSTSPRGNGRLVRVDSALELSSEPTSSTQTKELPQPSSSTSPKWRPSLKWRSSTTASETTLTSPPLPSARTNTTSTGSYTRDSRPRRLESGMIVRLPKSPQELSKESVLLQQWNGDLGRMGHPFDHPCVILEVDANSVATVFQMTSIDVLARSSNARQTPNLKWASRYMPVVHNGQTHHPDPKMPKLLLQDGIQMTKASSVNVETELICECDNLQSFGPSGSPRLTAESLGALKKHRASYKIRAGTTLTFKTTPLPRTSPSGMSSLVPRTTLGWRARASEKQATITSAPTGAAKAGTLAESDRPRVLIGAARDLLKSYIDT